MYQVSAEFRGFPAILRRIDGVSRQILGLM